MKRLSRFLLLLLMAGTASAVERPAKGLNNLSTSTPNSGRCEIEATPF